MIGDAEARFDQLGDARRRPEIGRVARLERAGDEGSDEAPLLRRSEFRGTPRGGMHREPSLPLRGDGVAPPLDRTRGTPEPPRHGIQRHVLLQHRERAAAARFEDRCSTFGSHARHPGQDAGKYTIIYAALNKSVCEHLGAEGRGPLAHDALTGRCPFARAAAARLTPSLRR